jgi:hypothetical protein
VSKDEIGKIFIRIVGEVFQHLSILGHEYSST